MDDDRPTADSLGVWNGLIAGLDEELVGLEAEKTIDARGATITPGFHDVHNHMASFGQRLTGIDASTFRTLDELYSAVATRARDYPDEEWITGSGYDQTVLGRHPEREKLDAAGQGRKVMLIHRTSHMLVASTQVFESVGALDAGYQAPEGGFVERDGRGLPTGLVAEQAMAPFRDLRKPVPLCDLVETLVLASDHFVSEGLTSVAEAGIGASPIVGSSPVELAAYKRGHVTGRLRVRTQLMVAMENFHELDTAPGDGFAYGVDLGIRTGLGGRRLSIGPLKIFTDGALMSQTASMSTNFCGHDHAGIMQFGFEKLCDLAVQAHGSGWQLAVHAIGDHAVDIAMDVIEAAENSFPRADPRHRIEHASAVRPDQLRRIVEMGIIPSPQGRFVYELGDGVAELVGADRLPWTYRHKSFLEAGLTVPGSSDRPVAAGAPLLAMQSLAERLTASGQEFSRTEAVSAYEALKSYTLHAAYASLEEGFKGRLRGRYLADFVVLSQDPTSVPTNEIGEVPIQATFVDGEPVYNPAGDWA